MANTISEKTKVTINVVSVITVVAVIISCTAAVVRTLDGLSHKHDEAMRAIADTKQNCWRVEDQAQYATEMERLNRKIDLTVPDVRRIARERYSSASRPHTEIIP